MIPPDFLVIGHVVQDLVRADPQGWRLGGTASYASLLAARLGLRAAVLTAAGPDLSLANALPGVEVVMAAGELSTQIRNVYRGGHRTQYIPRRASLIEKAALPEEWRQAAIVLLGPVAGEVDDGLAGCFPAAPVGVSAQGWLRETGGASGRVRPVHPSRWNAEPILRHAVALFVSDEDLPQREAKAVPGDWSRQVETVAFTHGEQGADICQRGVWRHVGAFPARSVDPTGAGDIFAAAFLIRLHEGADVWEAARFAACAASFVVEGEGTANIPSRLMIEARLAQHPEIVPRPAGQG